MRTWLEWKWTDIKSAMRDFHIFYVCAQKVELACALTNNNFFKILCAVLHVRIWLEWKLTDIKSVMRYFHIFHVRAKKVELACTLTNNNFFKVLCAVLHCALLYSVLFVQAWCCVVQLCAAGGNPVLYSSPDSPSLKRDRAAETVFYHFLGKYSFSWKNFYITKYSVQ